MYSLQNGINLQLEKKNSWFSFINEFLKPNKPYDFGWRKSCVPDMKALRGNEYVGGSESAATDEDVEAKVVALARAPALVRLGSCR